MYFGLKTFNALYNMLLEQQRSESAAAILLIFAADP